MNDNSNPQQGTLSILNVQNGTGSLRKDTTEKEMNLEKSTKSAEKKPITQRSTTNATHYVKVPPTKKDSRKLFVGGLPSNVTNDEFRTFFEGFGTVIDSVVMIDRDTRRSRGFGFVTFADLETAQSLLKSGNEGKKVPQDGFRSGKLLMRGKMCEVKISEPKEVSCIHGLRKNSKRNATESEPEATNEQGSQVATTNGSSTNHAMTNGHLTMYNPEGISRHHMIESHYGAHEMHHSHFHTYYPNPYMGMVPLPNPYDLQHFYPANDINYSHHSMHLNPPMDNYGYVVPFREPYPYVAHHHFPTGYNQDFSGPHDTVHNPNNDSSQSNHAEAISQE